MTAPPPLVVLFRVAAGPQVGFGHLARSRALARELGVPLHISLRGSASTAATAQRLGASVLPGGLHALARFKPRLVVVDDPDTVAGARWVAGARRRGVAVASIHDGLTRNADADLVVDGSVLAVRPRRALTVRRPATPALRGPEYAVLDLTRAGDAGRRGPRERWRVLVALGGGAHVRQFAAPIAQAIGRRCARARVVIAAGFSPGPRPALPANARWIDAPGGLGFELSRASAAVIAGGVTLYEAAALATPIVTLAIVPAQCRATRAFARRGAVLDAGLAGSPASFDRVARHVVALLNGRARARALGLVAGRTVDGRGAARVAAHLRRLAQGVRDHRYAA